MALTLVTGRANTGKTGVLHAALRDALAAGRPATLLLPTRPDVRRTEAELGADGLVGARIAVLDDWIEELWRLHGDGRAIVGPALRAALLSRACEEARPDTLAGCAASPGFARLLSDIVKRLVRAPGDRTGIDGAVVSVLRAYDRALADSGVVERSRAAAILADAPPPIDGAVLVNRFTDLSEPQELLLSALGKRTQVVVALTWEPDLPATQALDPLIERMFADAHRIPMVAPPARTELETIEERLYCPGDPVEPAGALAVGLAAGDEAECALAARAARRLIGEGIAPERIAIVFRDAARRAGLLASALETEGVPADLDIASPVTATPFGAALCALVRACAEPSRERLLAYLAGPYSGAEPDAVEAADARWRRYRAGGERLLAEAGETCEDARAAIKAARRAAVGMDAASVDAWRALCDALFAAAARAHAPGSLDLALDAAAHRAVTSLASQVAAEPEARLTSADALRLLSETTVAAGPSERPGAVQVTEAHRVRSRRFDALVLGGLTAGEFSSERVELLAAEIAGRLGAAPGLEERDAERMLFYLVVTRARRRLVLLRQDTDARGEPRRPSVFWDEIVDLYAPDADPSDEEPAAPPGVEVTRLGLSELASAAPAFAPGRRDARAAVVPAARVRRKRGKLADEDVLATLAAADEFSVTELETYLACPYRWFHERAVRPHELDSEVDAREQGSRAHTLLAAFYEALAERGHPRVSPETLPEALRLFDEVAARVEPDTAAVGLRERLRVAQAEQWARGVVADDADLLPQFRPVCHEFAFGAEADRPFRFADVALRGSVDRIDEGEAGFVVTDYKSQKSPPGYASFLDKGLIQPVVYAAAVESLLGARAVAGLYRSLRSLSARGFRDASVVLAGRGSGKDVVDDAGRGVLLGETARLVSEAAAGIREGRIAPMPRKGACEWCGARVYCEEAR